MPFSDWKVVNREEIRKRTQARNEKEGQFKGKKYFEEVYSRTMTTLWFKKIKTLRFFVTTVNRIRANHINVKESLERKNYVQDNTCDCGRIKSLRHLLFECEKYVGPRDVFIGKGTHTISI